jgi:hypothetical protein
MRFNVRSILVTPFNDFPMTDVINLARDTLFDSLTPEKRCFAWRSRPIGARRRGFGKTTIEPKANEPFRFLADPR